MKDSSIEEAIKKETERRISMMEQPDYPFPKRMNKVDFTIITAFVVVSLLLLILCMTGVIR